MLIYLNNLKTLFTRDEQDVIPSIYAINSLTFMYTDLYIQGCVQAILICYHSVVNTVSTCVTCINIVYKL